VDVEFFDSADEPADADQFAQLYRDHYAELLRFAMRRVDRESAREVVADTFLIAWRRFDVAPSRAWLFAVARKVLSNELRSGERRERLTDRVQTHTAQDDSDIAQEIADRDEARALLAQLPLPEREALELTEWDGLTATEAAQVAGCSPGAFRVRLHRARRRLANLYRQNAAVRTEQLVQERSRA
jgi:RNA polymerase sigma factor (sigma-70 family)